MNAIQQIERKTGMVAALAAALCFLGTSQCGAGWLDQLFGNKTSGSASNSVSAVAELTADEMTKGLREALGKGAEKAISNLGKQDGFLKNLEVKIPMPEKLQEVEKGVRMVGQGKYADEFILTMNRAAEGAVPEAGAIIGDAIKNLTIEDAKSILHGPDDAATQYFRKVGEPRLREQFMPVVKQATEKAGVTAAYKKLTDKAGFMANFLQKENLDVDKYVTDKALDGLFKMLAVEEKEIRTNPVARSTDLLKKVFGSVAK